MIKSLFKSWKPIKELEQRIEKLEQQMKELEFHTIKLEQRIKNLQKENYLITQDIQKNEIQMLEKLLSTTRQK